MKLLFCIMGDVCNGKYETYQYLKEAYRFHPYKTLTTKKVSKKNKFDTFQHIPLGKMLLQEELGEVICVQKIKDHHYGKRISDLKDGFSVGIIDYKGYLELSEHFHTVPILIKRSRLQRFNMEYCDIKTPSEFLTFEELNREQYNDAIENPNVLIIEPENMIDLKVEIDRILEPYIEDISYDVDLSYQI